MTAEQPGYSLWTTSATLVTIQVETNEEMHKTVDQQAEPLQSKTMTIRNAKFLRTLCLDHTFS
jgi:hypothetical protein